MESTMSKLRDAVRGKLVFDYASSVTAENLAPWWAETVVKRVDEHVYIGPPDQKDFAPIAPKPEGLVFDSLTATELDCFAILLNNGRLQGPIIVKTHWEGWLTLTHTFHNVELVQKRDGTLTLL